MEARRVKATAQLQDFEEDCQHFSRRYDWTQHMEGFRTVLSRVVEQRRDDDRSRDAGFQIRTVTAFLADKPETRG
jgi:hypothetical protein